MSEHCVQARGRPEKYCIRDMWFLSTLSLIPFKSLWSRVFCWQAIMSLSCVKHIVISASSMHLHVQLNMFTTCWCWQMLHAGITRYQKYTSHTGNYKTAWHKRTNLMRRWKMEQILYVLPSCGRNVAGSIALSAKRKTLCWMEQLVNRHECPYHYLNGWQTKN